MRLILILALMPFALFGAMTTLAILVAIAKAVME